MGDTWTAKWLRGPSRSTVVTGRPVSFMLWNIWAKMEKSKVGVQKLHTRHTVHTLTKTKNARPTAMVIQKKTGDLPLVLHGGSGIPEDMVRKAISLGVSKVNVNTECQIAFAEATRAYIEAGKDRAGKGFAPRALLAPGLEATKAKCIEKMTLFGSIGKA